MNRADFILSVLAGNIEMLEMTLGDFSEADLLVRPVPTANHTAWQLGQLIAGEIYMHAECGAKMPAATPEFMKLYSKEGSKIDDPHAFLTKAEYFAKLREARAATIAFVRSLSEADFDKPAPEKFRSFAPTVGAVIVMACPHMMMHMGQMQVIRRKLGKPIIF